MDADKKLPVEVVESVAREATGVEAQAHDIKFDGREALELRFPFDKLSKVMRLSHVLLHESPVLPGSVLFQREPDFKGFETAREVYAVVAKPHLSSGDAARGVLQVLGCERKGMTVCTLVPHERHACFERNVEPFMEIESNGVGALNPCDERL